MDTRKIIAGLLAVVVLGAFAGVGLAANPYGQVAPMEGYLIGKGELAKAQGAMVAAQAAVIKATGEAALSNVKALESLESARGRAVENTVNAASTFYEKRKLYETYQGMTAVERASKEDLSRFGKATLPMRSSVVHAEGAIQWPELFLRDEFNEARTQLDYVFAQRNGQAIDAGNDLLHTARVATVQLRKQLRKLMKEITPAEYTAARKFVDNLAIEAQMAPQTVARMAASKPAQ